jgi:hypothetical protein
LPDLINLLTRSVEIALLDVLAGRRFESRYLPVGIFQLQAAELRLDVAL